MTTAVAPSSFAANGSAHFPAALDETLCALIEEGLADLPQGVPGVRLASAPRLAASLAVRGSIGSIAASVLGDAARAVRVVLFDKTVARNWGLGRHQDRTIVVAERAEVLGFGPWTVKAGLVQVEPPFATPERMLTLRVHLDPVDATNAPLRIVPGSHRLGRLAQGEIDDVVARSGERYCLAERGDIWLYATPIVHGSKAADPPRRRRVLQVDYSADPLPAPLQWAGL